MYPERQEPEFDWYFSEIKKLIIWYTLTGILEGLLYLYIIPGQPSSLYFRTMIAWPFPVIWAILGGIRLISWEFWLIPLIPFFTIYFLSRFYRWKNQKTAD